jgi:glutathione S-transferase
MVIGPRRCSPWALRGSLAVHLAGSTSRKMVILLSGGGRLAAIRDHSPNGMVPYREPDGARTRESIAIAEYCAELAPPRWPA